MAAGRCGSCGQTFKNLGRHQSRRRPCTELRIPGHTKSRSGGLEAWKAHHGPELAPALRAVYRDTATPEQREMVDTFLTAAIARGLGLGTTRVQHDGDRITFDEGDDVSAA